MASLYKVKLAPVSVKGQIYQEGETFELDENFAQPLLQHGVVEFVKAIAKTPPKTVEKVSQFAPPEEIAPATDLTPSVEEVSAEVKPVTEPVKPKPVKA